MSLKTQTFTVSLRIVGQDIKLIIHVNETLDDVFQKLKLIYPNSITKKKQILDKLIGTLKIQLQMQNLNSSLLQSISLFLQQNDPSQESHPNCELARKAVSLYESKNIQQSRQNTVVRKCENDKQNTQMCHYAKKMSLNLQASPKLQKPSKSLSNCNLEKEQAPLKPNNRVKSVVGSKSKKIGCNPDLIKACEIIMKKAQNTEMKQMAKQFLKQKGFLKQQKEKPTIPNKKNQFVQIRSIPSEIVVINQVRTESSTSQKPQQKPTADASPKCMDANVGKGRGRLSKYKYLELSLVNESLSKQYSLSKEYQPSIVLKQSENKPKKYSYLQ